MQCIQLIDLIESIANDYSMTRHPGAEGHSTPFPWHGAPAGLIAQGLGLSDTGAPSTIARR